MAFSVRSGSLWLPSIPRVRVGGAWVPPRGPSIPTRYVNTESSGGDGTTPALSGANAAFSSLADAISAIQSEETDCLIRVAGGADPNPVGFAGGTWGDRHIIIEVEPASRMGGVWDAGKYHLAMIDADALDNGTAGVRNLTLRGLAVQVTATSTSVSADAMDLRGPSGAGTLVVDGVFVRFVAPNGSGTLRGLRIGHADRDCLVMNSITWSQSSGTADTRGVDVASGSKVGGIQIYNHTSVGNARGYGFSTAAQTLIMNSIAYGNADSRNGNAHSDSDYNVSDDGDFGNTNDDTGAVLFVDAENGDFRLHADDEWARGLGTDLSAVFTHDAAGNTRTVPWDRGAVMAAA